MWAVAGTPKPIVALLYREIARAVTMPDVKERFVAVGFEPAAIGPADFAAVMKAAMAKWAKVIKDANIRP